jgi:EAL domain-containing protein (putative c-di-GMP-specific phosphodiesterase class I)
MVESIRSYQEHLPILTEELVKDGYLSLLLLDVSPFSAIEEQYGMRTYALVRQRLFSLLKEQAGKDFRKEDILALEDSGGLRILLFLSHRRQPSSSDYYAALEALRLRLTSVLIPKLLRTAVPYLRTPPRIPIGFGLGIYNPLIDPHHIILRIIREALDRAEWQYRSEQMESMQRLKEVILREEVLTLYQPIVDLNDEKPMAYEALSRGNAGTAFQSADDLFETAIKNHLLVELDRVCRKKALAFSNRLPSKAKIFINTLPATMRDPEFQGKHLIDSLERAFINPDRIVIEITERLVIDNLILFQDAMSYYTDLGMALAVDDVGSGYSGLETIAKLKPSFLKVDMSLVHDIHTSVVNREMLNAIVALGRGIGAKVIAEGIEIPEELRVLRELNIDYGQGYLLGRPELVSGPATVEAPRS